MENISVMIIAVLAAGLAFDFVNGFHDAANSIATIVATRVLKPVHAVLWAAFFNFAAVFLFGTGVAKTMGAGLIDLAGVTPLVVLCGLIGAVAWGLMTWWRRLPTSSSHALLGGYAGAAMAHHALHYGWMRMRDPIIALGWIKVTAFIVIAPVMGLFLARILMGGLLAAEKRYNLAPDHPAYKVMQLVSSAFLSLMHGSNDAQKTAGILAGALTSAGMFASFTIPYWLLMVSYGTMGLGTLAGGWRIVRTMGQRLTRLQPQGGVCAETAAALSIFTATIFGLPVSTTHATTGAILGVGVAADPEHVRWTVARRIAWGWIFTIPAAAFMGGCVMIVATYI
ncbi:MAG: inorganic phosphate transporter [Alphaproteobacteria bacterium]|nr:inorganic phosphate transporter [Alphaproteobacteria bacterium]